MGRMPTMGSRDPSLKAGASVGSGKGKGEIYIYIPIYIGTEDFMQV